MKPPLIKTQFTPRHCRKRWVAARENLRKLHDPHWRCIMREAAAMRLQIIREARRKRIHVAAVFTQKDDNLASKNFTGRVIAIATEWSRGCSGLLMRGQPWECRECTLNMVRAIKKAFEECSYDFEGVTDTSKTLCISCKHCPVTWPRVCDHCQDKEAQAELRARLISEGEEPNEWACRSCGMIYDGGQFCTYCGDEDPRGIGE